MILSKYSYFMLLFLLLVSIFSQGCIRSEKSQTESTTNSLEQTTEKSQESIISEQKIVEQSKQTVEKPVTSKSENPFIHGNPEATQGGIFKLAMNTDPTTLHVLNASDAYASTINGLIYETLLQRDIETLAYTPLLAKSWTVSEDKLSYTFVIDERATFQDGKPVTVEDVKFSYDVIFEPTLRSTAKWQSYYPMLDNVTIIDQQTVQINVKYDHFRNLFVLSSHEIIPKHKFDGAKDINKVMVREPMGSGAYVFKEWKKKSYITLDKNPNYWGKDLPQNIGANNFQTLRFNLIEQEKIQLEQLKKGNVDYLVLTPKQWMKETNNPPFGTTIRKLSYVNKAPKGYSYIGWRLEDPLFQDKRVRTALSHLIDREEILNKIYFDKHTKSVGIFYHNSEYNSQNVGAFEYSPEKASALFAEAGWKDSDGDLVLDKDNLKMSFSIITANPETATKTLPLIQNTMKKGGVEIQIQQVDFATLLKLIDEQNFKAVTLGWSRTIEPDPTPLWHSKYAVPGGQNFVYFKNKRVDQILEAIKFSIPTEQRIQYYQELHSIINEEQPYAFLFEGRENFAGIHTHLRQAKDFYNYGIGTTYWWIP